MFLYIYDLHVCQWCDYTYMEAGTANVLKDSLKTKHNFVKHLGVNAQVAKMLNCRSGSSHTH